MIKKKFAKSRCPGRISLSKHADYINSHLLYVLDDRETIITGELAEGDSVIELKNSIFGNRFFKLNEIDSALENKLDWSFYILKIIKELKLEKFLSGKKLSVTIDSKIPAAGGLSSSHALMLSILRNFAELFELKELQTIFLEPNKDTKKTLDLIFLCQRIEQERGFKSGLGDQCAQLFSKKGYLTAIKIFPDLKISYIKIPDGLAFITVPSFITADKSTPEFIKKNTNIAKYKLLNLLCKKYKVNYLADLHEVLTEAEIFAFLDSIDDKLTRGLALYGLAESKRVKELIQDFNPEKLGKHLNLSHQAELNYHFDDHGCAQELSDEYKLNYLYDKNLALSEHSGYYHASTQANDKLQYLANKHDAVYGSSLTGAGFGGNNIIALKQNNAEQIKEYLKNEYYQLENPNLDLTLLHLSTSNSGVSLA